MGSGQLAPVGGGVLRPSDTVCPLLPLTHPRGLVCLATPLFISVSISQFPTVTIVICFIFTCLLKQCSLKSFIFYEAYYVPDFLCYFDDTS